MRHLIILSLCIFLTLSCHKESNKAISITIDSQINFDSIYISDLNTEKQLVKSGFFKAEKLIELDHEILARVFLKKQNKGYKLILEPSTNTKIFIGKDSSITTGEIKDSLLNHLYDSNLEFINQRLSFVFKTQNFDSLVSVFEKFRKRREIELSKQKNRLSDDVLELLYFQNDALVYNFLFWLGKVSKELEPNNTFFDYIDKLPRPSKELKSFPKIYLEKFNVLYFRKYGFLDEIEDFLDFLEFEVSNEDLSDYLKAIYIKEVTEFPDLWKGHSELINTESLALILKREIKNPYKEIYSEVLQSFYSSQKGEIAYNFEAIDKGGKLFELDDFRGSVVLIDAWATWCGPCIVRRPDIIALAKMYRNKEKVKFLFISLDSEKEKWLSFLSKNENQFGYDLFLKPENRESFRSNYNARLIPKYILIDENGVIRDSNLKDSITEIEKAIEIILKLP